MRIGIDGRELLAQNVTGIGRYLRNFLISEVRERSPHTFVVYGNQYTSVDFSGSNVDVRIVPERLTLWWDQALLSRSVRTDRLDVLFSPYDKGPCHVPCPLILTVHDLLFTVVSDRTGIERILYNWAYVRYRKWMAERAALVITVSEHARRDIISIFGIPEDKICVVPNGVSEYYHPIHDRSLVEDVKQKYGVTQSYILYIGNFKPHKNVRWLVEAYRALPDSLKEQYQLVLCGRRDHFRTDLEAYVRHLQIERRTTFVDFVSDGDMPVLYSGAEIFVFPSLYEGFGLPPLEAMACGTPVISSNATSLPEVIGDAGVLVDPRYPDRLAEAMTAVLTDAGLRRELGLKGLCRARMFSVDRIAKRLLQAIEEAGGKRMQHRDQSKGMATKEVLDHVQGSRLDSIH